MTLNLASWNLSKRKTNPTENERRYSAAGTGTTAFPSTQMTDTLPHSSHCGVDTATKPLLKVIKLPVTVFLDTSTKSWQTSHTRRNALMTKCINDTLLWDNDIQSSFFQAVEWWEICGRNGIILNPD